MDTNEENEVLSPLYFEYYLDIHAVSLNKIPNRSFNEIYLGIRLDENKKSQLHSLKLSYLILSRTIKTNPKARLKIYKLFLLNVYFPLIKSIHLLQETENSDTFLFLKETCDGLSNPNYLLRVFPCIVYNALMSFTKKKIILSISGEIQPDLINLIERVSSKLLTFDSLFDKEYIKKEVNEANEEILILSNKIENLNDEKQRVEKHNQFLLDYYEEIKSKDEKSKKDVYKSPKVKKSILTYKKKCEIPKKYVELMDSNKFGKCQAYKVLAKSYSVSDRTIRNILITKKYAKEHLSKIIRY